MYDVDENGYVKMAYFEGSRQRVARVCEIIGINPQRILRQVSPKVRLAIFADHKISPENLKAAEEFWNGD